MTKQNEQIIDSLYLQLQLTETLSGNFAEEMLDCIKLFDNKQHDYGSGNISKSGYEGVIVRLNDKLERIINLQHKGEAAVKAETIDDTLRDIANYALIALMCRKGIWPKL
jgi:hypothetical protein